MPFRYYKTKLAVERLVEESGLGWTVLRATQFHDLLVQAAAGLSKLPVMLLPAGVRDQPVEVAEVADRLAELAAGAPAGRVEDMGGPEVRTFGSLAHAYLKASGAASCGGERTAVGSGVPGLPERGASDAAAGGRHGDVRGVSGGAVRGRSGEGGERAVQGVMTRGVSVWPLEILTAYHREDA